MKVHNLLKPNKIAVIGASETEGSFGEATCKNIMTFSDSSKYYFVNPNRKEVFGKKCYKSLEDIDGEIDLIIICTPQSTVIELLKSASKKGCKGAVVYASGYSESGTKEGLEAEEELIEVCNELGISLLGPNCGGFINYIDDVYSFAFIAEERDRKGKIGLISQSGQLALSLMDNPKGNFSYVISAGNASVITVEEYIEYLVDDEDTKVVSVYLEGISKPDVFERALRKAAEQKKPVVILKTGRSEKGSQISESHTGSLSGSDETYNALFKKYGVIRADDMEELLSISSLLAIVNEYPKGSKFAALSVSGGETIITADIGELKGIEYSKFSEKTMKELNELLPDYATPNNPLDMTATLSYDSEKFAKTLETVMNDDDVDIVLIGYTLLLDVIDPCIYYLTEGIEMVRKNNGNKPIVMMPFVENTRNKECADRLLESNVSILPPPIYAMSILKKFSDFINYNYKDRTLKLAMPENKEYERKFLSEHQSKELLKNNGFNVPSEEVATSLDSAIEIANDIGYPLVMKIESEDIPHKSDAGGVVLNVKTEEEVESAYEKIMSNVKSNEPDADINGILIQEMLDSGLELIIGINNDPLFGPMVLCGLGGIFVEVFKDIALYPAPFNESEALEMIKSLKGFPLLNGYRGNPKLDVDGLVKLLVEVSEFADEYKDKIVELDINPIFLYEEGIGIADALIVAKD